jgi:hypothetical protein
MNESSLDYVSVVGTRLVQPVIDLIEKLELLSPTEPNEVQSSPTENGYSCAVVVLSALVLESALNRTRYLRKDASEPPHVADYFRKISNDGNLALDVNELFAIRDAIVQPSVGGKNRCSCNEVRLALKTASRLRRKAISRRNGQ